MDNTLFSLFVMLVSKTELFETRLVDHYDTDNRAYQIKSISTLIFF